MTRAVVFAYHDVGVRGLATLLDHGIEIPLVVTHTDSPNENIWFASVAALSGERDIPFITPDDVNAPEVVTRIAAARPDFIFSFYFRQMLGTEVLALAPRGAFNLHGSLLPKYRGRVPVNWAVLHGETETGATLHEMVIKPDAGRIAGRQRVPILADDTAHEVFKKLTVAAELCLDAALPGLIAGTAVLEPQDLAAGSYFGGRKPEDGRIDWTQSASAVHNLVRAVAPPYPGAFCDLGKTGDATAGRLRVLRTQRRPQNRLRPGGPGLYAESGQLLADCGDGVLRILDAQLNDSPLTPENLLARFGPEKLFFQTS